MVACWWATGCFALGALFHDECRSVVFAMDMTQNLVSWIDRGLFPYHLYLYSPDHNARDPEGLLSDLPAIGTALMGVLTGIWLRSQRSIPLKAIGLAVASATSLALGRLWSFVSAEQEHVDQFLRSRGRWILAGAACVLLLGH